MASSSTPSAKWTDDLHKLFVELCAVEVIKGNRVGTYLNKEGWGVIHKEFMKQKNVNFSIKQFKNHWESMKGDYKIFSQLKFGESGLGWNEITKKIDAPDMWWIQKAQANPRINKFRNKDLSLFMQFYETLFGDIVATGERAKAAATYSAVDLEVGGEYTEAEEDDGKEGSGDSDENNSGGAKELFPPNSLKSGRSSGTKRKKSGAECLREGLDGLVAAMSCRSTQTTAAQASEDASFNAAVDLLDSMEHLVPAGSDLYYFAGQHLRDKANRTLFLKARNDDIRFGQLVYHYKAAGYPHKRGYMAPYKGARIRYHIQDFRRANGTARAPRNAKEKFNHLHSSCRMVIERTFGVWKARFAILANLPMYKIDTQTDIVLATMAIHNYIRKSNTRDSAFETAESETYIPGTSTSRTSNMDEEAEREDNRDDVWIAKRDTIAAHIT